MDEYDATPIYSEQEWKDKYKDYEGDGSIPVAEVAVEWNDPFETPTQAIHRLNNEVMEMAVEFARYRIRNSPQGGNSMSLDVMLSGNYDNYKVAAGSGIFVREGGSVKEISRKEWDKKFPGQEPLITPNNGNFLYTANITHNLNKMASECGLYECLWRPNENGFTIARDLIAPLEAGIQDLKSAPSHYKQWDAPNGWGKYENLLSFAKEYLAACKRYPDAGVSVSR